ncbi:uncharacterized protein [Coffea arabica]|uniref:Endonuclease/exonuclease/phosphatase domain-containing protein n=1 Tax=Coffea arabica TaxID=13443 RepID=A0A6P6SNV6_COFAR|nr:uncharacterized protein LOC113693166 [Coffea arabica]
MGGETETLASARYGYQQFLAEKQQLWLRELCWKAFSINLHGKEDGVHRDYEEIEVGLSNIAGSIIMSFVHAKCTIEERRYLWSNLLANKPNSHPWYIGGDFNVITAPHEKRGGRPFAVDEGMELVSFMEEAGVLDVGFSGSSFTWCNNRRAISVTHLVRHPSDQAPLKISFVSRLDNKQRPFRFLNVWTAKPELLEVIRNAWDQEISGSTFRVLCSKLLATRRAIQAWNKYSFGNISKLFKRRKLRYN